MAKSELHIHSKALHMMAVTAFFVMLLFSIVACNSVFNAMNNYRKCRAWVHDVEWLGDTVAFKHADTCGHRFFTSEDATSLLKEQCILFIGDSLSRRLAATLVLVLLGQTSPQDLDASDVLSVGGHDKADWELILPRSNLSLHLNTARFPARCLHFRWAPYLYLAVKYLETERLDMYSHVILSTGAHEVKMNLTYMGAKHEHLLLSLFNLTCHASYTFILRTAPNQDSVTLNVMMDQWNVATRAHFSQYNTRDCGILCRLLFLIDHAKMLEPRSVGRTRIRGDSIEHFGSTARMLQVQSLLNLIEIIKFGQVV